jgi:hypothetical protein
LRHNTSTRITGRASDIFAKIKAIFAALGTGSIAVFINTAQCFALCMASTGWAIGAVNSIVFHTFGRRRGITNKFLRILALAGNTGSSAGRLTWRRIFAIIIGGTFTGIAAYANGISTLLRGIAIFINRANAVADIIHAS